MAKEKKGYQGYKVFGDTMESRKQHAARMERAQKNAMERQTNELFALQDTLFKEACEKGKVTASARQASKYRNGYGQAARAVGKNVRKDPRS